MIFEALVTLLAATRTTEFVARVTGVRTFLPVLSAKRFSTVGGIDEATFMRQMDECKSFKDARWTNYWIALASEQLQLLDSELEKANLESSRAIFGRPPITPPSPAVLTFLSQGAAAMTQTPPGTPISVDMLPQDASDEEKSSFMAVSALLKAVAYFFVAAWPGQTQARMNAYYACERLFDILLDAIAPTLNLTVERYFVQTNGEKVKVYALLPDTSSAGIGTLVPGVIVTNGLEGTNVETMATALRTQAVLSSAWFFMEMPGTYAYKQPMRSASSEQVYRDVLSFVASHKSVDESRLGMIGISFGGNCATRMAIADKRLKAVVINGAPLTRSLSPTGSFGMPEIVVRALFSVFGAKSLQDLKSSLHALIPSRADIERIHCPVLAINGKQDTLISTQDTIDLAAWAPNSELYLYPDDDHCAMGHIREWLELGSRWLDENL
ncbi:alpha beta hydrolase family domain protein [Fusarium tjaetaba]|uniref:Alpha beta hydrolase family domain protein n=1 Tax=Fusarium tjaetaba TaxID=1567544 RepID=A0A8H5QGD4_9HYPO|nr:alpha beta hydrolase family domain protein [Fusarium tjaetaba]KAF5614769.1 alpha beta hydrolase family domain protein [Fusarium tjaetaba]